MISDLLPADLLDHVFDIAEDKEKVYFILKDNDGEVEEAIRNLNNELMKAFNNQQLEIVSLFEVMQNNMLRDFEDAVSLINDAPLLSRFGIKEYVELTYDLSPLNQSRKVLFNYALLGRRGNEGLLQKCDGRKIGRGVILVPKEASQKIEKFFDEWSIGYGKRSVFDFEEV